MRSVGSLERSEALGLQRRADTLLVLAEGNEVRPARSVATGKLFEYLGAGRPILVLGEESEAARIVREAQAGIVAPGDDPRAIADVLERLVRREVGPPPAPTSTASRGRRSPSASRSSSRLRSHAHGGA